jgi:hypothetical protein
MYTSQRKVRNLNLKIKLVTKITTRVMMNRSSTVHSIHYLLLCTTTRGGIIIMDGGSLLY